MNPTSRTSSLVVTSAAVLTMVDASLLTPFVFPRLPKCIRILEHNYAPLCSAQLHGFSYQFSSVTQSCPTLCSPMDCSMPGFLVHNQLPELTQTHAHQVSDDIHTTTSSSVAPFSSCLQSFPASGSFPRSQFLTGGQNIGASASVLPVNIQD